jgi:hypothetical protein
VILNHEGEEKTNTLSGVVRECVFRGEDYKLSVVLDGGVVMNFNSAENHKVDERVNLFLHPSSIVCLDQLTKGS